MRIKYIKLFLILVVMMSTSFSTVRAVDNNTLYFDENNGELFYETSGHSFNDFIINENMSPGIPYVNTMKIGNRSQYDFDLYLDMLTKVSLNEIEEKLLKDIEMKIYFNQSLVYEGNAKGSLDKILLGEIKKSENFDLRVETVLKMDTTLVKEEGYYIKSDYMKYKEGGLKPVVYSSQETAKVAALQNGEDDIIFVSLGYLTNDELDDLSSMSANTNWQFYAQRTDTDLPMEEIKPETGDNTKTNLYLGFLIFAGVTLIYTMIKGFKKEENEVI